jgi:hypothetical protein
MMCWMDVWRMSVMVRSVLGYGVYCVIVCVVPFPLVYRRRRRHCRVYAVDVVVHVRGDSRDVVIVAMC